MHSQEKSGEQPKDDVAACKFFQLTAMPDEGKGGEDYAGKGQPQCSNNKRRSFSLCKTDEDGGCGYSQNGNYGCKRQGHTKAIFQHTISTKF